MNDPHFLSPPWSGRHGIEVYSSTRLGGCSAAPFGDLNLGLHVGDNEVHVRSNRQALADSLKFKQEPLWLKQVHGTDIVRAEDFSKPLSVKAPLALVADTGVAESAAEFAPEQATAAGAAPEAAPEADAAWTMQRNLPLAVLTADCLPIVLATGAHDPYSVQAKSIAVIHAGWRGLANGILQNAIATLDAKPGSIAAWLGPAISPRHFEVGAEVREAFMESVPGVEKDCFRKAPWSNAAGEDAEVAEVGGEASRPGNDDKWYADLYAIARTILASHKITEITGGNNCTYQDQDLFYSYRRDGVKSGRMATLAVIRNN